MLFIGTAAGLLGSALLILSVFLPSPQTFVRRRIYDRTTRGLRLYLATPRLRGLLAFNLAAASAGAMVLVNTVVMVRTGLGLAESQVAVFLGAFGAGSMTAALILPRLLDHRPDRPVMMTGAWGLVSTLCLMAAISHVAGLDYLSLMTGWFLVGVGYSAVLTPSGRLLRRSAHPEDRPALYAAQFALSHACWLVTYPLAGVSFTTMGATTALGCLAALAAVGAVAGGLLWRDAHDRPVGHSHDDLPIDHPHIRDGRTHVHPLVIDDMHTRWP